MKGVVFIIHYRSLFCSGGIRAKEYLKDSGMSIQNDCFSTGHPETCPLCLGTIKQTLDVVDILHQELQRLEKENKELKSVISYAAERLRKQPLKFRCDM